MHHIGIVVFPGFQSMHLGVSTVFELANAGLPQPYYRVRLLSEHGGLVASSAGFSVSTEAFTGQHCDTVIVAGDGEALIQHTPALLGFLRAAAAQSRRIAGPCTGAFALAEAGLLNGRRATTHWYHAAAFRAAHPQVRLEEDCIFVVDGTRWTSAGGTAGIDLALAMVEHDLDTAAAQAVARALVMYHRRSGGQTQFSALLELTPKSDRIQQALSWARAHLQHDLSVERLAQAASLSPRQFSRAFREETGQSPARAVARLRLESARLMMEGGRHPVDVVAREAGFGDSERMRRAFLRAFGQPPQAIRRAQRARALSA